MIKKKLTPLLKQYIDIKEKYKDCLIFFAMSINFLETSLIFSIGYMKKIPTKIINQYKTINLHPSLLPLYKGSMTYKRMIINNEKELGFTIHKVNKFIDEGRILYQKNSLIKNNDELKVINFNKTLEHKYVYVALKKICNNLDKL